MQRLKYKNVGNKTVRFVIAHKPEFAPEQFEVAPGDVCEIPAGYCQKQGERPSFIERRGNGMLVPVEDAPKEEPVVEVLEAPVPPVDEEDKMLEVDDAPEPTEALKEKAKPKKSKKSKKKD